MRIAVIITTYNRPDALAAVLNGYLTQRDTDFELIVADDGSTETTRNVVESFADIASFAVSGAAGWPTSMPQSTSGWGGPSP